MCLLRDSGENLGKNSNTTVCNTGTLTCIESVMEKDKRMDENMEVDRLV